MSALIDVDGLTRRFGDFTAVDAVSFQVEPGEIFGYLGANGAGKSTTIRMLCGLLAPTEGRATIAGHDIARDPRAVKRSIGYMSQKFSLYLDLTPAENLEFFAGAQGLSGAERRRRVRDALEHSGLDARRDTLTGALPGGLRQRLALASARLHQPRILFLDEPTAGVAPDARRAFWRDIRAVAAEGTAVFVTTHHLDEAEYCGRVGLMVDGRLEALDTPAELKRTLVPGVFFTIDGDAPRADLRRALDGAAGVRGLQPFGRRLRVRLDPDAALADADALTARLADAGVADPRVEPTTPNLEDVFLELVGREAA
ncbi:MAG: ABC transporter ATP-binding protein [Myxococcales bacterium]|nr:ABC transporter ATP-binding protein [Myxococcales bacterium]